MGSGGRSMKGLLLGSGCRFFRRIPRNLIGIHRMEGRSIDEASLKRCGRLFPRSPRNLIGLRGVERRSIDGGDAAAELPSSRRFSKRLRRVERRGGRSMEYYRHLLSGVLLSLLVAGFTDGESRIRLPAPSNRGSMCDELIRPAGYPCIEHTAQTTDGYLLALQRVSSRHENITSNVGQAPPVLLLHGVFMKYWDWSWQELAMNDLTEMLHFIHAETSSKPFIVGHSQGTIMTLAGLTQPQIVQMVEAAALLCPISYLDHVSATIPRQLVTFHVDKVRYNCCFNNSRLDFYLDYEPNPTSAKNLAHLFQMIRKGTFARYDYGIFKNYKLYGQTTPPVFDLGRIPDSFPLWMGYGGQDGLADPADFNHTLRELRDQAKLHYVDRYGHADFLYGTRAKEDVYDDLIGFFSVQDCQADPADFNHTLRELRDQALLHYVDRYGHADFLYDIRAKEDVYDDLIGFFKSVMGRQSATA
ncbi:unnamed protein product [Linum tenue]|uniref:Partial AB-hydrolase lipase domain-containing protein n=1 Tax=Linum tenue TaxID=586396 RepID=A0AAV0MHM4_9ROSI|nr:unnamed protein product [Linum tenue]